MFSACELPWCQPGQTVALSVGTEQVGWLGRSHPDVLDNYDLEQPVFAAEINLEQLLQHVRLTAEYLPLPRYPAVLRDLAVVVPDTVTAKEVIDVIYEAGGELVEDVTLFDLYRGPQIPENCRSLAFCRNLS